MKNTDIIIMILVVISSFIIFNKNKKNKNNTKNTKNTKNSIIKSNYQNIKNTKNTLNKSNISDVLNTATYPLSYDIQDDTDNLIDPPQSYNADDEDISDDKYVTFTPDLYKDTTLLFGDRNLERQFYTLPNYSVPNGQTEFAKWAFDDGRRVCKNDTTQCYRYHDIRRGDGHMNPI